MIIVEINENKEFCKNCGGRCCKKSGCDYWPSDLPDKTYKGILKFLENGIRLAKDGAIIIADNVLFKGRVLSDYNEHKHRTAVNRLRSYLEIINSDKRLKSTVMNIGDGIAVSVIKK